MALVLYQQEKIYLPQIVGPDFFLGAVQRRGTLLEALIFEASPNLSVTTHSLTFPISRRPTIAAFVRCIDITFSKTTQKIIRWSDLHNVITQINIISLLFQKITRLELLHDIRLYLPRSFNGIENGYDSRNVSNSPYRNLDFRNQNSQWQNDAVECKCDNMGHYLPYQKETIKHM